jgi:hypothetical protein
MVFAAAVVLGVEVIAFAVGFVWAFVWHFFLKPTGCILRRLRLLTPAMLVLATLASFWLVFNNLLDKTLAVWSFVGGVLALCGLIAWFIFDVLAGPRNNE